MKPNAGSDFILAPGAGRGQATRARIRRQGLRRPALSRVSVAAPPADPDSAHLAQRAPRRPRVVARVALCCTVAPVGTTSRWPARFAVIPSYVALFFCVGIAMPYWPAWLESRSLSPAVIGVLLGVGPWVRLALNPAVGRFADRRQLAHRLVVIGGSLMALAYLGLLLWGDGVAVIAALVVLLSVGFGPLVPLTDSVTLRNPQIDYPRVRAWGSVAFIAASFFGGLLLDDLGPRAILWTLLGAAVAVAASGLLLPAPRLPPASIESVAEPSTRGSAWRAPGFGWFLLTAALLNASHSVLYGFGTLHWRAGGVSETAIGVLWSIGVVAEIVLFTLGGRLVERLGSAGLFLVAGGGGVVRWMLLATQADFGWLLAAQLLHAATFACMHLGAMRFIRARVPEAATSQATSLYSAVATGLAMGTCMPLAGLLYDRYAGAGFWAMAVLSAAAIGGALIMRSRFNDAQRQPPTRT